MICPDSVEGAAVAIDGVETRIREQDRIGNGQAVGAGQQRATVQTDCAGAERGVGVDLNAAASGDGRAAAVAVVAAQDQQTAAELLHLGAGAADVVADRDGLAGICVVDEAAAGAGLGESHRAAGEGVALAVRSECPRVGCDGAADVDGGAAGRAEDRRLSGCCGNGVGGPVAGRVVVGRSDVPGALGTRRRCREQEQQRNRTRDGARNPRSPLPNGPIAIPNLPAQKCGSNALEPLISISGIQAIGLK